MNLHHPSIPRRVLWRASSGRAQHTAVVCNLLLMLYHLTRPPTRRVRRRAEGGGCCAGQPGRTHQGAGGVAAGRRSAAAARARPRRPGTNTQTLSLPTLPPVAVSRHVSARASPTQFKTRRRTAMQKSRIVTLGLARRDGKWPLNEGQTPNSRVVYK